MIKQAVNSMEAKSNAYIKRIEELNAAKQALKDGIADELKTCSEDIKEIYKEVDDAGISVAVIRAKIKSRALELKVQQKLTGDEMELYNSLADALPGLGDAARAAYVADKGSQATAR
jgi:uncharacterized protein (UPF0335 family)